MEFNELGARGVGEIGLAGFAAAVTDAVHDATGVRVRALPVTIEKLLAWRVLASSGAPAADRSEAPSSRVTRPPVRLLCQLERVSPIRRSKRTQTICLPSRSSNCMRMSPSLRFV